MDKLKQQFNQQYQQAAEQVKSNTRLRVSLWFILFLIISYPCMLISDYNQTIRNEISRELERESKTLRTADEKQWFQRADELVKLSEKIEATFWQAPSTGIAKATLFQTLTEWAQNKQLENVQVRLEEPLAIEEQAGLYRIAGQIDTAFDPTRSMDFLRVIETHDLKIVIEQMEISQRARPIHRLVIAAYFKIEN